MESSKTPEQYIKELEDRIQEFEKGVKADQIIRSIAINSPSNIMLLDLDARIQYINHTVPGITPNEMVGLRLPDIVEEEFRPGILGALQRVATSAEPDRYETSYTSPSGDFSWWESGVGPVIQDSQVTGFVVVSTNTTEQRRRTEEQERFFNLSVDMMCVADFNGYLKRINQAFINTMGDKDVLLSQSFMNFVHPDDVPASMAVMERLKSGVIIIDFSNRCRASDGSWRLLSWRSVADPKREVIYAVARDITQTIFMEEQLQQSRKMEAIGQLAGGIAHDFNNVLTAIQGNIELAQHAPKKAGQFLRNATEAVERAGALTRQLLVFSRHESLSPKVLVINPVLANLMNLLKRLLPENIIISLQQEAAAPPIIADQSQLEQVVVNLCVNARDAMPIGGELDLSVEYVQITSSSHPISRAEPGEYVVLTVSDTGCGMTQETISRIFEPFFTTKGVGKGTGLGLATVYAIVQKHKGFIDVHSEPGKGTKFHIYWPVSNQAAVSQVLDKGVSSKLLGGNETVLIAEDDVMVQQIVAGILEQAGYTVLCANDGMQAVQKFSEHVGSIALVVLDVVMPNMGGLDAAAEIRKLDPEVSLFFVSGHVQRDDDLRRLEKETLLHKPYLREELLKNIRNILDSNNAF